jgi:hypothetical protein
MWATSEISKKTAQSMEAIARWAKIRPIRSPSMPFTFSIEA